MAIPRNLANLANQLNTDGEAPKIEVGDSSVAITDTGSNGTITLTTDGSERMRVNNVGKVIIGGTTPLGLFNLVGVERPAGPATYTTAASSTKAQAGLNWYQDNNSPYAYYLDVFSTGTSESPWGGSNIRFFSTAVGTATATERMRIDSSGNIQLAWADTYLYWYYDSTYSMGMKADTSNRQLNIFTKAADTADEITFSTGSGPTERARITSVGNFLVGTTTTDPDNFVTSSTLTGGILYASGAFGINRSSAAVAFINRLTDDGTIVSLRQAGVEEGTISVSGNTVSYNSFAGSHWSQFQQGRGYNPEVPRGTVLSTIGEMCEWKSAAWDEVIEHPAVPTVEAKEAVLDEEGNVVEPAVEAVEGKDAWTETVTKRETYIGDLPFGATFEEDGVIKTVVDDGNERLPKVKVSDVVGDKAVYGVFQTWDEAQDMLVTSLGAFVVRIAAGVTVQIGDLLESNGDGCAKVQDDDIIRSKTIGKVTSTTATATYDDGSYTVPCVLYCG